MKMTTIALCSLSRLIYSFLYSIDERPGDRLSHPNPNPGVVPPWSKFVARGALFALRLIDVSSLCFHLLTPGVLFSSTVARFRVHIVLYRSHCCYYGYAHEEASLLFLRSCVLRSSSVVLPVILTND